MNKENIPPMEELEKVIDALLNGQEPKSNLDPEIIKTIKSSYENIKNINPDKDFREDLLKDIVKKLDKAGTEKKAGMNWFYIKALSGLFASLVLVTTAYFFLTNLDITNLNPQLPGDEDSTTDDGKTDDFLLETNGESPVLAKFDAADRDESAIKDEGEYKERFTDGSTDDDSPEFARTGGGGLLDASDMPMAKEEAIGELESFSKDMAIPTDKAITNRQEVNDLKGGEMDDNENFNDYKEYFTDAEKGSGYNIDISQRFLIEVTDSKEKGILGKEVIIVDDLDNRYELVTDTDGSIYFYPSVYTTEASRQNENCRGKNNHEPMPPILYEKRMPDCNRTYAGYYYDERTNMCIKETTSACSSPYPFDNKESCETACIVDQQSFETPSEFAVFVDNERFNFKSSKSTWKINLDEKTDNKDDLVLDLAFTLDTTGSMSDQINRLKMTIESISEKIARTDVNPKIRYGLIIYRDKTDEYITRIYDFTDDLDKFKSILETVRANGGGDYPEDVNSALADTLEELSWSNEKNAVRIDFLVADAPPHMDYGQKYDYRTAMLRALELGVKIFPIASSGLDNTEGEFMFRQIALITNAKYVFITDARGGTDYHIDEQDYSVNALDELVVKLIKEELEQIE